MKIKIIDDDIQFMDSLKNTLTGEFDHVLMDSSTSFEDEYDYDIYFLDIDMPYNGLEVARKIKQFNENIIVIFVSFREDLIFEALQTFPYYFLRKKYLKEELPIVINKIKKMLVNNQIDIYYKGKEISLDASKILYIEKNGQYTHIVTEKNTYIVKHSMKYYEKRLSVKMFGHVSQGFLANYQYVESENSQYVLMKNGHVSYYSRDRRKRFLDNYLKYITLV